MTKYSEIVAKIESLQKEAEQVRKQELREVITDIKKKIRTYGLTLEDLGDVLGQGKPRKARKSAGRPAKARKSARKKGGSVPPKYRHPQSGDTWSGRGLTPKWLAAELEKGKKKEDFLIK